jgi:hypothetical protein
MLLNAFDNNRGKKLIELSSKTGIPLGILPDRAAINKYVSHTTSTTLIMVSNVHVLMK